MATIPKQVSDYMRKLGQKGGSVSSKAKAKASKRNGKKGGRPARRFCDERAGGCGASISEVDVQAGYCTNCKREL